MRPDIFKKVMAAAGVIVALLLQWSCFTLKSPRRAYRQAEAAHEQFDAVIIPGIPFEGRTWSETMRNRVLWSWILYKNGFAKNIIYSGGAVYSPYFEAKIMGLYAQQLGIPAGHIFYETKAEHSTENVYYSYELARKQGFKTLALATEYNQALLLKGFVNRRFATRITILPIFEEMLEAYATLPDPVIDPAPAYKADFKAMPEAVSSWERFRGTIGKNIPWENRKGKKEIAL